MAVSESDGQPVTAAVADELSATAETLVIAEGLTERTRTAISDSVRAARAVLATTGSTQGRRRLSKALGRQAVALAAAGQLTDAVGPAREALGLSRQALLDTQPSDATFDPACGELAQRINDLSRLLFALGQVGEARQLLEQSTAVAARSAGPLAARAALGTREIKVASAIEQAQQAAAPGRRPDAGDTTLIAAAEDLVADRRGFTTQDEPLTIFDLGQALHMLGEAYLLHGRDGPAAASLAEAYSIFTSFDGPSAQGMADQTRVLMERMTNGATPGTAGSGTAGPETAAPGPDEPGQDRAAGDRLPPWPQNNLSPVVSATDARFDEGIRLMREGNYADAAGALDEAVDRFLLLTAGDERSEQNRALQRRLALSYWRYMQAAYPTGQTAKALNAGRTGMGVGLRLLDDLQPGHPDRGDVLAETVSAISDLGELTCRAGQINEGLDILGGAIDLAGDDPHQAVRRALGTVLHNLATHLLRITTVNAMGNVPSADAVGQAFGTISAAVARALSIREDLAATDLLARWELANTLLLSSKVAPLTGQPARAIADLGKAMTHIRELGPSEAGLAAQARQVADMLEETAPGEVRQARAAGTWPF